MNWIVVMVGGGLGSAARYGLRLLLPAGPAASLPWATACANVVGCVLGGVVLRLVLEREMGEPWRLFLLTGVLGGFTTFSAFGVETVELAAAGKMRLAVMNVVVNVGLSLLGCVVGYWGWGGR
jgi:fluoride exporter